MRNIPTMQSRKQKASDEPPPPHHSHLHEEDSAAMSPRLPHTPVLNCPGTPREHDLARSIAEHPQIAAAVAALADIGLTATLATDETGGWFLTAPHGDGTVFVIGTPGRLPEHGEPIRQWVVDHYMGIEDDNTTAYVHPAEPDPVVMARCLERYRLWCPRLNATGTARAFVDYWDDLTTGDVTHDFGVARESALWNEGPGCGTLADKKTVTLISDEIMDYERAGQLARELLTANDSRIADPGGPAGAIRAHGTRDTPGWILFGWAPFEMSPCA